MKRRLFAPLAFAPALASCADAPHLTGFAAPAGATAAALVGAVVLALVGAAVHALSGHANP